MALSLIQSKKQGNRKSSEGGGWWQQVRGVGQNLRKGGRGREYLKHLYKIGGFLALI